MHDIAFYVHIGVAKTATKTIQTFLAKNRDLLLKQGVLYPRSVASKSGSVELHRVVSAALELCSVPWLAKLPEYFPSDLFGCLRDEIAQTDCKSVILSSEDFALMREPELLRSALLPHRVRVLVYIRRHDGFLASFYNQLVKSTLYQATFSDFLTDVANGSVDLGDFKIFVDDICRYDRLLERWRAVFGGENISVGVYEDFGLPTGILTDFAARIGFDVDGLAVPHEDTNRSLPLSLVSLKRRVNGLLAGEAQRISAEAAFSGVVNGKWPTPRLEGYDKSDGLRRRMAILSNYEEGDARVAKEYFSGREFLFEKPTGLEPPLPDFYDKIWNEPDHDPVVLLTARFIARSRLATPENLPPIANLENWQLAWDGVDGLYVHSLPMPQSRSGPSPIQLIAAPTDSRHRLGIRFRLPAGAGIYRVAVLLRMDRAAHAYLEVRDGTSANFGIAHYDLSSQSIIRTDGALRDVEIGAADDGWSRVSSELVFGDDTGVIYIGLLSPDGNLSFMGDGESGFQFWQVAIVEQPKQY